MTESITITSEMIREADYMAGAVEIQRNRASKNDAFVGVMGEFVWAQFFYGDWRKNRVGQNRGRADFGDIEIKASALPYHSGLNLLVRREYAKSRKPSAYVQIIIDTADGETIKAGATAYICGFATASEIDNAPMKDFGSRFGGNAGYLCHFIPISKLHPIIDLEVDYKL